MLRQVISPIAILIIFFAACKSHDVGESADVSREQVYQVYWIDRNDETGIIQSGAKFRFGGKGGTTLHLTPPSYVAINGYRMNGYEPFLQGYEYYYDNLPVDTRSFEFAWFDTTDSKNVNSITLQTAELIDLPDVLDRNQFTLQWEAGKLKEGERMYLELMDTAYTVRSFRIFKENSSRTFTKENITSLANGPLSIYIFRTLKQDLDQPTQLGGYITYDYRTRNYNVLLN